MLDDDDPRETVVDEEFCERVDDLVACASELAWANGARDGSACASQALVMLLGGAVKIAKQYDIDSEDLAEHIETLFDALGVFGTGLAN